MLFFLISLSVFQNSFGNWHLLPQGIFVTPSVPDIERVFIHLLSSPATREIRFASIGSREPIQPHFEISPTNFAPQDQQTELSPCLVQETYTAHPSAKPVSEVAQAASTGTTSKKMKNSVTHI